MIISTFIATAALLSPVQGPTTTLQRAYVASHFSLELDGEAAGFLNSAEGGGLQGTVVYDKVGVEHLQKKHIAGVKYEDITVTCGTGMSKPFYEWVKSSFDGKYSRKNGSVVAADYNYRDHTRLSFQQALVTEVGFPALDASSKDAAKMTIKMAPEYSRYTPIGPQGFGPNDPPKDSAPFSFSFNMPDFQGVHVQSVDRIKVKFPSLPIDDGTGQTFFARVEDVDNFSITIPEEEVAPFTKWFEETVFSGIPDEKTASLVLGNSDVQILLRMQGLGIVSIHPEDPWFDSTRRWNVEFYCERMTFDYKTN